MGRRHPPPALKALGTWILSTRNPHKTSKLTRDSNAETTQESRDDHTKRSLAAWVCSPGLPGFAGIPSVAPLSLAWPASAHMHSGCLLDSKRSHTENNKETAVGMAVPSAALMCPRGTAALSDLAPELAEGALRYMPSRGSFLEALVQLGNTRRLVPWSYCVRAALTIALGQGLDAGALVTSTHNRGYTQHSVQVQPEEVPRTPFRVAIHTNARGTYADALLRVRLGCIRETGKTARLRNDPKGYQRGRCGSATGSTPGTPTHHKHVPIVLRRCP